MPATTPSPTQATLEEAARKPGKVVRNDGDFDRGGGRAPRSASRRNITCRISRMRRWSRRRRARASRNGKCEVWGCFQSPQAARDLVAKRLGMPVDDVTVHVTLLGGGFGRKSKPDFGVEAAVLSQGDGRQAGQGRLDARRRPAQRLLPHGIRRAPRSRRRCAGQAGGVAASQRRADDRVDLHAGCQAGGELGARHGRHQRALRHSQHPHRESGSDRAHAHRLVPLGVEHSARLRGAVVRRRAGRRGGARPEGLSAGGDRPRARGDRRRC